MEFDYQGPHRLPRTHDGINGTFKFYRTKWVHSSGTVGGGGSRGTVYKTLNIDIVLDL